MMAAPRLLLGIVYLCFIACAYAACPYIDTSLKPWGSATSWPSGVVPGANSDVVIGSGQKIVLNVSPPALKSITVENGGQLIWGNYDNLEIVTGALLVKNAAHFWVGSEDCLFTKNATITLTGTAESTSYGIFGNKVLGVGAGGTLELHGAAYAPTWTRLAATVKPMYWKAPSLSRGLNVAILNPSTGAMIAYQSFDTHASQAASAALTAYLQAQATGSVVALVCADECSSKLLANTTAALQGIGSTKINQLLYRSGWAAVGVKGAAAGTAAEDLKSENERPTAIVTRAFANFAVKVQAFNRSSGLIEVSGAGQPVITLAENVNWKVGQRIVVASTDNDYTHAEENEIVGIEAGNKLRLKTPFTYTHWGAIESGVDERAEVGLISRSILVRGRQSSSTDTYGGQTRFLVNFTNIHLENVEFYNMGQDGVVGSYPIHFHMAFDVDARGGYAKPAYVKGCAIWKSFNRAVTIHGTSGLLVKDNVAYDHKGHGYFLEDGSEQRNVLDRNLGLVTRYGNSILSDWDPARCTGVLAGFCKGPATYWLTNPNNVLINNAAAGSVQFGIWYIFPAKPTGLSAPYFPTLAIPYLPLGVCKNNYAHSSPTGVMVDDGIVDTQGPTYLGIKGARYRPHALPNLSSPRIIANFDDLTVHHCSKQGIWMRGGDFRVNRARVADNVISVTLASEGTMPNDPGSSQEIYNSIFVGITANNYTALLNARVRGFEIYDGPVRAVNCSFINFPDNNKNSSAVAAKANNVWQIATTNEVAGCTFTNVFKPIFYQNPVGDGDRTNIFIDTTGNVAGKAGWNVVTNLPIHTTKRCEVRPQFQASVCPEQYGQLYIMNRNVSGTNYTGGLARMTVIRDDKSSYPLELTGIGQTPPTAFQPLVLVNKTSYTLHFAHASPPSLSIQMTNFDKSDTLRVGVCYPKDTIFNVRYKRGSTQVPLTQVSTLAAVDANSDVTSSYFWDNTNGLLFVKLIAVNGRNGLEYCGSGGCESVEIAASGPNVGKQIGYCPGAYPLYAKTEL